MIKDLDEKGIIIKTIFDGYDFLQHDIGKTFIPTKLRSKVISTTYIKELYDNADKFLDYCYNNLDKYDIQYYIDIPIVSKYKVGIYSLIDCFDENNPWKDKDYILFNSKLLKPLMQNFPNLKEALFWVCPSFDINGKCDAIGFRIVKPDKVFNAFKWIFTCGNNIIYGKDYVDKNKECYVVEGFRDYVALRELNYNVIGLGSVVISPTQEKFIKSLSDPILLLDGDSFGLQKTMQYKDKYRIATIINSSEKDAYDTWIKYNKVDIMEIK